MRFADGIDLLRGSKEELRQLIERLYKTATGYGMEISFDNCKILVNSIKPKPSAIISIIGKTLEEVDQFKYLGSTQAKDRI